MSLGFRDLVTGPDTASLEFGTGYWRGAVARLFRGLLLSLGMLG